MWHGDATQLRPSYSRRSRRRTESEQRENGDEEGGRRRRKSSRTWFIHEERADNSARSLLPIHYFAKRRSARRQGHRFVPPAAIVPKYSSGSTSTRGRSLRSKPQLFNIRESRAPRVSRTLRRLELLATEVSQS